MTVLAAAATGAFALLLVAALLGRPVRLPRRVRVGGRTRRTRSWLAQAGVRTTPARFWAASGGLGVLVLAAIASVTATPVIGIAPAIAAGLAPRAALARRRARRLREVAEAWPDGLRDLASVISAGMSLTQALGELARRGPEPLQRAFARFPLLVRVVGVTAALEVIRDELAEPMSDRVIEVLILAYAHGGRMVTEILHDLADTATRDARTSEEIATAALEQRINARAVLVLPWFVLLALTAAPGHFRDFYQSAAGAVVIALAASLSLFGVWLVGRLSREHVEERLVVVPAADGVT
jgi:tight adherence protein B